jgi:hypothetical protein
VGVKFIGLRDKRRGTVKVDGPVTGLSYTIGVVPTPVSDHDADGILAMTGDPCCGAMTHMAGVKVKLFGPAVATVDQMKSVPQHILNAVPKVRLEEKLSRSPRVRFKEPEPKELEYEPIVTTIVMEE